MLYIHYDILDIMNIYTFYHLQAKNFQTELSAWTPDLSFRSIISPNFLTKKVWNVNDIYLSSIEIIYINLKHIFNCIY